jgi:hypothetical protein
MRPEFEERGKTMIARKYSFGKISLWLVAFGLLLPSLGSAQRVSFPDIDGVEVARDATDLRDEVDRPDRDIVDTVLAFTNLGQGAARVSCVAFAANGEPVGSIWISVPANGMRFALASDISGSRDFTGHARCRTGPRVLGTSVLLAPGAITDLSVRQIRRPGMTIFTVIATY